MVNITIDFGKMGFCVEFVLHAVGAVTSFVVLQEISNRIDWQSNKIVLFVNRYSMSIYLLHQQIIYFVILIFNGRVGPMTNAIINFVISLTFSVIASWLLSRNRITSLIIGLNK